MNMWIPRTIKDRLHQTVDSRPVVLLTGARQTGKSSLLQREFPRAEYVSFDHLNQVEAAKDSPDFFLGQFKGNVILDEIQYVPDLFRELKIVVDSERTRYGKWILTGSQQFELMEKISESLAGRISILHLETLSARELREGTVRNVDDYTWKGGYPEIWANPRLNINDFFESYIRTYIERDLKTIIDVKNLHDFQRFIRVIAGRVGQLINYKDISSDIGVSDVTIRKWLHALEVSGIVYLLAPFYRNIGKRLAKSPKLYFADHGLLCHLLGINSIKDWQNHIFRGNIWENIVLMELVKTNNLRPGENIFFYRDQNAVEIDFIVEKKNTLFFIEAKAGERLDESRLNFKKVLPLFSEKYPTRAIVAQNIKGTHVIKKKDYTTINPLAIDMSL